MSRGSSATGQHWQPNDTVIGNALARARDILQSPEVEGRLVRYYSTESNYAGGTFTGLGSNAPYEVAADDLLAVTTLSVDVPPMAIRRLLEGPERTKMSTLLCKLPPDSGLDPETGAALAVHMAALYTAVKKGLRRHGANSSNAWVTASKICARKRPGLFPVRDRVVVKLLGLTGQYREDWPVFAALVSDDLVTSRLGEVAEKLHDHAGVDIGRDGPLRLVDVALWMSGMAGG